MKMFTNVVTGSHDAQLCFDLTPEKHFDGNLN